MTFDSFGQAERQPLLLEQMMNKQTYKIEWRVIEPQG